MMKIFFVMHLFCALDLSVFSQPSIIEKFDRGIVALNVSQTEIYIGWRLLKNDPSDIAFNVYRKEVGVSDFVKINESPITQTTNFIDKQVQVGQGYRYRIRSVESGKEKELPGEAFVFAITVNRPYYSFKLHGNEQVKRAAIADLNGDGSLDFIFQHPDINTDPYYKPGYWQRSFDTYKLDAYTNDGHFLWRYDMGWSIEMGTWYAPYLAYDVDEDGYAEVYCKAGVGDPREMDGRVMEGPEFLVKLNPKTGLVVKKRNWISRDSINEYNFWCRNFLSVAYLNGINPSLQMHRGTYTTLKIESMDKNLKTQWKWESVGKDKNYSGQGAHHVIAADINDDGKDELIPGTFCIDGNGKPLWRLGLGHNDAGYLGDLDPDHQGLEIIYGIETWSEKNGICLVNPKNGEILWGLPNQTNHVHGQAMAGDIDPTHPGTEFYSVDLRKEGNVFYLMDIKGNRISEKDMGLLTSYAAWWDADDTKEMINDKKLFKYNANDTLLSIEGKILFVADIVGDWREEIVTALPGEIRIYSTNIPALNRRTTLLQDHIYRMGLSSLSVGYGHMPQLGESIERRK